MSNVNAKWFSRNASSRKMEQNWAPKFFPFRERKKVFWLKSTIISVGVVWRKYFEFKNWIIFRKKKSLHAIKFDEFLTPSFWSHCVYYELDLTDSTTSLSIVVYYSSKKSSSRDKFIKKFSGMSDDINVVIILETIKLIKWACMLACSRNEKKTF